jgi:hypothetical protein
MKLAPNADMEAPARRSPPAIAILKIDTSAFVHAFSLAARAAHPSFDRQACRLRTRSAQLPDQIGGTDTRGNDMDTLGDQSKQQGPAIRIHGRDIAQEEAEQLTV